jgi:hypothetical protein
MWCALFRDVFRTSPFACSMHLYIRTHSHKRNWSCGIYTHTQINCCVHTYTCCTDHSKFPIYSHLNWLNSPLIRVYIIHVQMYAPHVVCLVCTCLDLHALQQLHRRWLNHDSLRYSFWKWLGNSANVAWSPTSGAHIVCAGNLGVCDCCL